MLAFLVLLSTFYSCASTSCCPFSQHCICIRSFKLIDCSGQALARIPPKDLSCTDTTYRFLSLRGNNIICPDLNGLDGFNVDLNGNPLNCTCLQTSQSRNITVGSQCSVWAHTSSYVLENSGGLTLSSIQQSIYSTAVLTSVTATSYYSTSRTSILPSRASQSISYSSTVSKIVPYSQPFTRISPIRRELSWIIETSVSVPMAILVIGVAIIVYKCYKRNVRAQRMVGTNTYDETIEMDDDIVIYSITHTKESQESTL